MLKITFCFLLFGLIAIEAQQYDCNGPPPMRANPRECCPHPKPMDDSVFQDCMSKYGGFDGRDEGRFRKPQSSRFGGRGGPGGPRGSCMAECAMNATKSFVNGNIDRTVLASAFAQGLNNDATWLPIFTSALDSCISVVNSKRSELLAAQNGDCSPIPGYFMACMYGYVLRNCPASVYQSSTECNSFKDFITACPTPPIRLG